MRQVPLLLCFLAACAGSARSEPMTEIRFVADGFGDSEADIRALLTSAGRELWQYFPGHKIEPIVVMRGREAPITLYKRNDRGEIVMHLNTGDAAWSQYSYQFAHEFCHVLCGYKQADRANTWFEETLCETASLFTLRSMGRSWKKNPPYPNWKDYRDSLREYADDVIRKRDKIGEIHAKGLPAFYLANRDRLEKEPTLRDINGAMSIVLLRLFEEQPDRWESIRWLNATPARKGDSFQTYLQNWHDAAPGKHQPFIRKVGELYGVAVKPG